MVSKRVFMLLLAAALAAGANQLLAYEGEDREGGREGEGRQTLCVVPVTKMPQPAIFAALQTVFGQQLKITPDATLKIVLLSGREAAVDQAVRAIRPVIDLQSFRERRPEEASRSDKAIGLVQLRNVPINTVTRLIQQAVSGKLEMTPRPDVRALIFEGEEVAVAKAVLLARQLDRQEIHPSLRRFFTDGGERRDGEGGERPRREGRGERRDGEGGERREGGNRPRRREGGEGDRERGEG